MLFTLFKDFLYRLYTQLLLKQVQSYVLKYQEHYKKKLEQPK